LFPPSPESKYRAAGSIAASFFLFFNNLIRQIYEATARNRRQMELAATKRRSQESRGRAEETPTPVTGGGRGGNRNSRDSNGGGDTPSSIASHHPGEGGPVSVGSASLPPSVPAAWFQTPSPVSGALPSSASPAAMAQPPAVGWTGMQPPFAASSFSFGSAHMQPTTQQQPPLPFSFSAAAPSSSAVVGVSGALATPPTFAAMEQSPGPNPFQPPSVFAAPARSESNSSWVTAPERGQFSGQATDHAAQQEWAPHMPPPGANQGFPGPH
jgi:hypothetical protein